MPVVHVRDVPHSTTFCELFCFEMRNTYDDDGRRVWCCLVREQARFMLARAGEPIVASRQAMLFSAYVHDLDAVHRHLAAAGLEPGPAEPSAPGPDRGFRIDNPDGPAS